MNTARPPMGQDSDTFSCIAVDMGASSIRVMLGTLGPHGLQHQEVSRTENASIHRDGHERWDIPSIFKEITHGIAEAGRISGGSARSIGVDGWGVDYALLDKEGALLEWPVSYRDGRTGGMKELWEAEMSMYETFRRTGINYYQFNTLYQLLSLRGGEQLLHATTLLFLPSYISFLLTGTAFNELTIASTSQMLEVEGEEWDREILNKLQIGKGKFAPVISPGSRLGPVLPVHTGGDGLEGVAVCGHDTASVVAAIPAGEQDYVFISAGTWCIVGIESTTPLLTEEVFASGFTNERGYGNSYRILKNIVGLWLLQGLRKQFRDGISYAEMEKMASDSVDPDHLINPEAPGFFNPPDMKKAFDQFFRQTDQTLPRDPGGYIRCAYQSLCFSFRNHIEMLERYSGRSFRAIHLVGGGSQSDYLNQQLADISSRPVISGPVEAATIGNIVVQSIAMGRIADLNEGRARVRESCLLKKYLPDPKNEAARKLYQKFLLLK